MSVFIQMPLYYHEMHTYVKWVGLRAIVDLTLEDEI